MNNNLTNIAFDKNDKCAKCDKEKFPQGRRKPEIVKRVFESGKRKYQLRGGEEGVSIFDGNVSDKKILPYFREGGECDRKTVEEIKRKGLKVIQTHGDCDHLKDEDLQDQHWEICPGDGMTRKQFKKALKTLSA